MYVVRPKGYAYVTKGIRTHSYIHIIRILQVTCPYYIPYISTYIVMYSAWDQLTVVPE